MRLIEADAVYKILESCEIRKAIIGNPLSDWEDGYTCGIERAESEIECAPTVEAELKWIPVTERLPEDNRGKQIIITLDPSYGDGKRMVSRCAYFTHGRFYSCESHGVYMNSAVKAWMPLPEPYEVKHE